MGAFTAIALNGFREARRNRVTVVVALFAVVLLLSSSLVVEVTVNTFDRVLTDVGLGAMSMMMVLLAVFLSSGMLPREIERRTLFLVVSKPVSRGTFLVARMVGNMLTLTVLLAAMALLFVAQLKLYASPFTQAQALAIAMLWVELWVLSAVGFLLSSFSSQMVSAFVTVSVYFAGHLSADIYKLAGRSKNVLLQELGRGVYYLLPNLERLNYRPQATYNLDSPMNEVLASAAYGAAYTALALALAVLLFNRRDFR